MTFGNDITLLLCYNNSFRRICPGFQSGVIKNSRKIDQDFNPGIIRSGHEKPNPKNANPPGIAGKSPQDVEAKPKRTRLEPESPPVAAR
jgi:hypothetical protein